MAMTKGRNIAIYVVVAVAATALGIVLATLSRESSQPEHALVLQTPRPLPDFSLIDHRGDPFVAARLRGHWTLAFFGFTNCPDVCPTTLQTLARTLEALSEVAAGEQPSIVMISVDPMRDTQEKLATYVPYFHPEFTGITGSMGEIQSLTRNLGVAFAYTPRESGEDYDVEHTASIFLIDPQGRLSAVFGTPHHADRIAADYRRIVEGRE